MRHILFSDKLQFSLTTILSVPLHENNKKPAIFPPISVKSIIMASEI